jgi:hypothetical protein
MERMRGEVLAMAVAACEKPEGCRSAVPVVR